MIIIMKRGHTGKAAGTGAASGAPSGAGSGAVSADDTAGVAPAPPDAGVLRDRLLILL